MTTDEKYIRRCIELASNGQCGEGHAEVNAIRSVKDETLLKEATIYVSLEPCSHYGKTPPCADLIISKGIPRVVVGCIDPFSQVSGRGIRKLREAGIDVTVGVLEEECKNLIRRFVTFNTQKRPYITLKWAESADGYIDINRENGSPVVLSTPVTSMYVHKQRAEHKAILVGRRTALLDNPSLTTRNWYGKNPLRLVIDRNLTLPAELKLFDHSTPTMVFTEKQKNSEDNLEYVALDFSKDILPQICTVLYDRKIQSLLVEGGTTLLQSFIDSELWDEIFVEHSENVLYEGVKSPIIPKGTIFKTVFNKFYTISCPYIFGICSKYYTNNIKIVSYARCY